MIGYVYFAGKDGQIKIGWSTDPVRRVASQKAALLGVIRTDRSSEKLLHAGFASTRTSGEWFSPSDELQSLIDKSDKMKHSLTVFTRIPKILHCKINRIAKRERRTSSQVILFALEKYLRTQA